MRSTTMLATAGAMMMTMPAFAEVAADAPEDGEIIVTGRAEKLYRVEAIGVGKVPGNPLDIAQSVQVITNQLIRDQGARDITDLYRNIPSVSFFSYSGVTFRGFRQDIAFYDNLRGNPFVGFAVPQLFNIDRVEVLKGPSGMLYGPGAPGGIINYVTKKPSPEAGADLRAIVGNFERRGGSAEVTGPITASGNLYARGGLFYEKLDSFRANAASRTFIGDGGLTLKLAEGTTLTGQVTFYDQELPANRLRGVPVDLQGNFLASRRWNHNEPTDYLNLDADVYQARLESQLTDAIRFDLTGRWFGYDETQQYHEPVNFLDTNGDRVIDSMSREFRDQIRRTTSTSFGANLVAKFGFAGMTHTILLGGDWSREQALLLSRIFRPLGTAGGVVPPLSLRNPVYGTTSAARYNLNSMAFTPTRTRAFRRGAYLQDQVGIGEWLILSAGIRKDWFKDINLVARTRAKNDDETYRFGAIVKPRPDVSIYASWSDTFDPQSIASQDPRAGGPFAPTTGTQIEGGVKTALLNGRIQSSAAVYRIIRKNIVQATGQSIAGINQLAPIGEITSKGFEFDIAADITPDWVVTFNYGRNNTRVTGAVPGQTITNSVGNRFVNAPKHKLGLWTRYQLPRIDAALAVGAEYVSTRLGFDNERVKPYTIFDASLTKDFGLFEAMVRIENIFDKTYAASGFGIRTGSFPGDPRTVFLEIRRRF